MLKQKFREIRISKQLVPDRVSPQSKNILHFPEKAKIMGQVQKLLPIFGPEDIESVLNVKMAFDEIPESDLIFSKILALPGHILSKIFKLNLSSGELEALEAAAERFIHDEDIKSLIGIKEDHLP